MWRRLWIQLRYRGRRLGSALFGAALLLLMAAATAVAVSLAAGALHAGSEGGHGMHVGLGARHVGHAEMHVSAGSSDHRHHRLSGPLAHNDPFVLDTIRRSYLTPPSTQPYQLEQSEQYEQFKFLVSFVFLATRMKAVLGDMRDGFFVEAGALDGQYLSNTLSLEQELGWTGLLVEANPDSYRVLRHRNRRAWLSPTCLSPNNYPQELILNMLEMKQERSHVDLPWIARGSSHLQETSGPDQEVISGQHHTTYANVQCFPLASLLLAINVTHVDLLSLDVEGGEEAILRSLPWAALTVSVLLVEHHGEKEGRDNAFYDYIIGKGFHLFDHFTDSLGVTDYVFLGEDYWRQHREEITRRAVNLEDIKAVDNAD